LSEAANISLNEVKGWLERETGSIFVPVHAKAEKLLDEMSEAIENLVAASQMLFDNSAKEIEKRNMKTYGRARALNKLARLFLDRLKQIKVPEQVSYDSLKDFAQETQKAFLVTEVDVKNWFPRISPFFILDRRKFLAVFEKSKISLKELNSFLTKEYVKTKTLEETFQLIEKLGALQKQLEELKEKKAKVEAEKALVEREISDKQQKIASLKNEGGLSQLKHLDMEIETLNAEVRHALQHLQKPFIKLQALSLHGGGSGLTQDELKKLDEYMANPFNALATEEIDHPMLRSILQKLKRAMSEGKISLKPDKKRKAEQAMDNILNKNSLADLQRRCVNLTLQKRQLSTSENVEEAKHGLSILQKHLEDLEKRKEVIESEMNTVERAISETEEKIRNYEASIEKNILEFTGKQISISNG
jgi:predicted  nucleic acid-binding Zn-ribbon protein